MDLLLWLRDKKSEIGERRRSVYFATEKVPTSGKGQGQKKYKKYGHLDSFRDFPQIYSRRKKGRTKKKQEKGVLCPHKAAGTKSLFWGGGFIE